MVNSLLKYLNGDKVIWMIVIILSLCSIVVAYSASSNMAYRLADGDATSFLFKHMMLLIAGFTIMIVVHRVKFSLFSRASQLGVYIAAILLIVTLVFGVNKGNASRWIMGFQPSDFAKLVLLIYVARILAIKKSEIQTFKGLLPALIPIAIICGLILPADFSTAALLFLSCLVLLYVGGSKFKHLALIVGGCVATFGLLLLINIAVPGMLPRADTWSERVVDFFTGTSEDNYQSTQAQMGIVNGGVINFQPGGGSIKNDIFSAQSDFVYSTIVEEFGVLLGGLGLILLYLILFYRCLKLSARAKNKFGLYCFTVVYLPCK